MTLYRQLVVSMLVLFGILFLAAYWVQFHSTRNYLSEQQKVALESTANSVGLALTPYLETADRVGAESVINAAFDGGYYRKIRLELLSSGEVIEKEYATTVSGVPKWFTSLGLFDAIDYETTLTSGWLQLAKLKVQGHPGQAYYQLWTGMSRLLVAFVAAFLLVTLILVRALKYLLTPLEQIRHQAAEIELHHFGDPIPLPNTVELCQVVQSINTLSSKLAEQFKEQTEVVEVLRERAFLDIVSGLGNRSYFVGQVNAWIAESGRGGIMLIAVDLLDDIYRDEGFSARDQMVRAVAEQLRTCVKAIEGHALARISATEFAILLPGLAVDELLVIAEQINRAVAELVVNPISDNVSISVVGIASREPEDDLSVLLTKADNALRRARDERLGAIALEATENSDKLGRMAWKELIRRALHEHNVQFRVQPVVLGATRQEHHLELLAAIRQDDQYYPAGQFMPAIEQFKLGSEFDRHVLTEVAPVLHREQGLRLAVNLTVGAIGSRDFHAWLIHFLREHAILAERLLFEIPESAIVHFPTRVEGLLSSIGRQGFSWGVDHYGRHFQSLSYLEQLRPAYVKIDHGYTSMVLRAEGDQAFVSAICRAAHNIGAIAIASRVEDQAQVDALSRLLVDGYQGFISPPRPLP